MSCTFYNMRRRLAAAKVKEQPVEIHEQPVEPADEKPVEKPKRRVKKDAE